MISLSHTIGLRCPCGLERSYGSFHLHFITCSCYHRLPHLASPAERRDAFLVDLEEVRRRYSFVVVGYAVMPEHFHLLMSEPERGDPSRAISALKFRVAKRQLREMRRARGELGPDLVHFWQHRFYDFNVWTDEEADREAPVHAPESGRARDRRESGTVEMEQLSLLFGRRGRARANQ